MSDPSLYRKCMETKIRKSLAPSHTTSTPGSVLLGSSHIQPLSPPPHIREKNSPRGQKEHDPWTHQDHLEWPGHDTLEAVQRTRHPQSFLSLALFYFTLEYLPRPLKIFALQPPISRGKNIRKHILNHPSLSEAFLRVLK